MISNIDILKQDLPYIYNRKNFLVTPEKYHPANPKYIKQWNTYKKWCIEGRWVYDVHGFRFMPATLFSYGNFFKIEDQDGKQRKILKPDIRDLDWLIHYSYLEAMGFSGFKDDDNYSSDEALLNNDLFNLIKKSNKEDDKKRYLAMYKSNGTLKEYVSPREYLRQLHTQDLGRPLYFNNASNLMIFGSRSGGKSYSVAGICWQTLTFDGLKEYTKKSLEFKPKVNISIGAGITDKSSELISKIVTNMELHGTDPDFGAWGIPGQKDFIPGPFYIDWVGSTKPNNASNPYRYEYEIETDSGWQTVGSGTKLIHVNYSEKKQHGSQAAAGSRSAINVYEEVGLMPNFVDALLSNKATVSLDGNQFGVQISLGTSGNIELVQSSKKVFNDPKTYGFLSFPNLWEPEDHDIGLFLPAYLTYGRFKDENGNTDIEESLKFYQKALEDAYKKDDPEVLRNQKMNHPILPSHMWVSNKGSYFPVSELLEREAQLLKNKHYKELGKPVDLIWDSQTQSGVRAIPSLEAEPFYFYPFDKTMSKNDGCVIIYNNPEYIKNEIPKDMYIYTLDPYVSENINEGGSIGCFQVWLNPKYTKEGFSGGQLCATYYGKHPDGKDSFYQICEKLIQYYGNCPRMLWYEANRGDSVRGYFIRKDKTYLLCIRPSREKGSSAVERKVTEYGFFVSNRIDKLNMITDAAEFLLQSTQRNGSLVKQFETLPDLFLIQQLIQYYLEGNFDAVSAFLGLPTALKELEHQIIHEEKKKKKNILAFISVNPNLFKK